MPSIDANQAYEFSLGQSDVLHIENVTQIISGGQFTAPLMDFTDITTDTTEPFTTTSTSTYYQFLYEYDIRLKLKNLRTYPVRVEYQQQFILYRYQNVTLVQSTRNACRADGSMVNCKFSLRARATAVYSYRVKWYY